MRVGLVSGAQHARIVALSKTLATVTAVAVCAAVDISHDPAGARRCFADEQPPPVASAVPAGLDLAAWQAGVRQQLDAYWATTLRLQSTEYAGPHIAFTTPGDPTACGRAVPENGMYCRGDQTIYLDSRWFRRLLGDVRTRPAATLVLAHEWAHEVQDARRMLDGAESPHDVRAIELDADCYAGMFVGAALMRGGLSRPDAAAARRFLAASGDRGSGDHGTGGERVRALDAGIASGSLAVCDNVLGPMRRMATSGGERP